MINFRYHLISLVAVFLALAIGIIMGSTVIDRAIVDTLRDRIDTIDHKQQETRAENDLLKNLLTHQDDQDAVLASYSVGNVLKDQTVVVVSVGDISNDIMVETRELLAQANARVGSQVRFSHDFLTGSKTKLAKDLVDITGMKALLDGEKNHDAQISSALNVLLKIQGGTPDVGVEASALSSAFSSSDALSQEELSQTNDPFHPISVILLVKRTDLDNKSLREFVSNYSRTLPLTIGLVGAETDKPSRGDAVSDLGKDTSDISVVDNAETPSGRVTLLIAHAQNLSGTHGIYGVGSKAASPAPAAP